MPDVPVTVTVAVALAEPLVALTMSVPVPEDGAVYVPLLELIVPPAPPLFTLQVREGDEIGTPNWS